MEVVELNLSLGAPSNSQLSEPVAEFPKAEYGPYFAGFSPTKENPGGYFMIERKVFQPFP